MKNTTFLMIVVVAMIFCPLLAADKIIGPEKVEGVGADDYYKRTSPPDNIWGERTLKDEIYCNGYRICVIGYEHSILSSTLEVQKWPGGDASRWEGEYLTINEKSGKDLTGNGIPNLVVHDQTTGSNGCNAMLLFGLGDELRQLARVDACGRKITLEDRDGDDIPEVIVDDACLAYWQSDGVNSPYVQVILRWDGARYIRYSDLMREDPPSRTELENLVHKIRRVKHIPRPGEDPDNPQGRVTSYDLRDGYELNGGFQQEILRLLHNGNPDSARQLLEIVWPDNIEDREEYYQKIIVLLRDSRFCPEYLKE